MDKTIVFEKNWGEGGKVKKIGIAIGIMIILIGAGFGYVQIKKSYIEKRVTEYLVTEKIFQRMILFLADHLLQI